MKTRKNSKSKSVTKAPKVTYPFTSKRDVAKSLATPAKVLEYVQLVNSFQTDHELSTLSTKGRNHRGWMSSDAHRMGKIAQLIKNKKPISLEDRMLATTIMVKYAKQIARYLREKQAESNPELQAQLKVFCG
jgi:hypothetical protein